jgi:hypothetical protein
VEQKENPETTIMQIQIKNLSDHTDLPCQLLTSLMTREIHKAKKVTVAPVLN